MEGAEQDIVPALAAAPDVAALIDVIAWECHYGGSKPCRDLAASLVGSGIGAIYVEPKTWSWQRAFCTKPQWRNAAIGHAQAAELPERTPDCLAHTWRSDRTNASVLHW